MNPTLDYHATLPSLPEVDVLVMGGGPAGIAAAVGAARLGADTLLVERFGFLGGNLTAGLVGPCMTSYSCDGKHRLIAGVFGDFVERMVEAGAALDPAGIDSGTAWSGYITTGHERVTPFEPEPAKQVAAALVAESGARVLLHSFAADVRTVDGRVEGVVLAGKGGLAYQPARLVIDCTGDGDVAAYAGAAMTKGRDEDGLMQPATLFFRIADVDDGEVDRWVAEHPEEDKVFESIIGPARAAGRYPSPRRGVGLYRTQRPGVWRANTTRVLNVDGTDPWDLTRAEQEGRTQAHALVRFFRDNLPGLSRARLLDTAMTVGIRESRRIVGDYTLTLDDLLAGRSFADTVTLCGYPVDIHNPRGSSADGLDGLMEGTANVYAIPYRCLVPAAMEGLLVAGRCLSATHEAAAAVRVMPPAFGLGHAAGVAAALAVAGGTSPRHLDTELLRAKLLDQGAILADPAPRG
ncbi:FAD-dependent oxidoreductase [Streptomonospora litoralis]|uniref:FAD-dependent oxidoreductase n=1 Tax=Streptomonospora litoralis TaxID=2498135 RepID=A0A4P6Q2M1_9ACTN|nr:FAD-dependent oxidoreductase [Streptomonospora litoralis]QBI53024.1 hypothetical protein EKD16_06125 [Streptomonospora litoralis]